MRKIKFLSAVLILSITAAISFPGCLKDKVTETYTIYRPIYKDKAEVYANIKSNSPQEVNSPGKIFLYGNYIFLNDIDKGVHIIDNSNPSNPVAKAFIDIPGNLDIAVKGNTLYADLANDLVVIDITNPLQARFETYVPQIFPERYYGSGYYGDSNLVIVGWIKKDTTVQFKLSGNRWFDGTLYTMASTTAQSGNAASVPAGISGSMARFIILNNYLYTVNSWNLGVLDITNNNNPQKISETNLGWGIETIYPFKDKLFIGSRSGMFIYDISNPTSPVKQGQFNHARACDPVIADDNYAYVTLRDGTACDSHNNQLDVVNISNLSSPSLLKTYPMTNPHGLSKDHNTLFICDGRAGLKIYNTSDPSNINLVKHISGIETYDAIAWNNNLVVVAKDGLYQYNYSDPANPVLRSKISVNR